MNELETIRGVRGCLITLDESKGRLNHYVRSARYELSLPGRVLDMVMRRESRLPILIREAADIYSLCHDLVAEKAEELAERKQELLLYVNNKLDDLEQYARQEVSVQPQNDLTKLREAMKTNELSARVTAQRELLEAKLVASDVAHKSLMRNEQIAGTEANIADVQYLIEVVQILSTTFDRTSKRMAREEEKIRAITETICTVVDLRPWSTRMNYLGERVNKIMQAGYRTFDDSLSQIKTALKAVEMPRLLFQQKYRRNTKYINPRAQ